MSDFAMHLSDKINKMELANSKLEAKVQEQYDYNTQLRDDLKASREHIGKLEVRIKSFMSAGRAYIKAAIEHETDLTASNERVAVLEDALDYVRDACVPPDTVIMDKVNEALIGNKGVIK